ncbi:hypothetical protein M0R36_11370 [bacterium]|jgi:hypothetical protein|nr:hypothetical protein [bacterium]
MNLNWKTTSPITLLIIITVSLLGAIGVIYAVGQLTLTGTGTVTPTVTPAVDLTALPATLAWGDIAQGSSKQIVVTITNNGDTDSAALLISTPNMPTGLTVTWELGAAAPIPARTSRDITFTLVAAADAQLGQFAHVLTIGY